MISVPVQAYCLLAMQRKAAQRVCRGRQRCIPQLDAAIATAAGNHTLILLTPSHIEARCRPYITSHCCAADCDSLGSEPL